MKKFLLVVGLIVLAIVWFFGNSKNEGRLIGPTPAPIASPVAPKTFKFDSSTDLKKELEKVNPQVLDSDFE